MTNLIKWEQAGVAVLWRCLDCSWESDPLDPYAGQTEPSHTCDPVRYLQIEDPSATKGRMELVTERGRATAIQEQDLRQTRNLVVDHYPDLKWRHEQIGNKLYILIATRPEKR